MVQKWSEIPKNRPVIVQRYISRPYLINGTKFDLRIYVYVTNFEPLRIYVYEDGLARFASVRWVPWCSSAIFISLHCITATRQPTCSGVLIQFSICMLLHGQVFVIVVVVSNLWLCIHVGLVIGNWQIIIWMPVHVGRYSNSSKNLYNRYIHLTNYSVNRHNAGYEPNSDEEACQGHKW